jgi:hypothetical protein
MLEVERQGLGWVGGDVEWDGDGDLIGDGRKLERGFGRKGKGEELWLRLSCDEVGDGWDESDG